MSTYPIPVGYARVDIHEVKKQKEAGNLDEVCKCGHLQSQHHDTMVPGHGACKVLGCDCYKFTWVDFVKKVRR